MKRPCIAMLFVALVAAGPAALAEEVSTTLGGMTLNARLATAESWPQGPVVLLLHGTLAHRDMEIISGLQGMLGERGLSSLAINLSLGLDDRAAAMYDCPTPHRHRHTDAVDETAAWVAWLKAQGVERVVLLGHSRGGNQLARYAAAAPDPVVSDLVLVAPQTWDEGYADKDYMKRYGTPLQPLLQQAQTLVEAGKGGSLMGPMGFIYCEDTQATAEAVLSYYAPDPDMDTPRLLPRIALPVVVFAGTADTTVAGLVEKTEPLADGDRLRLEVMDGADHFFRDLYSEDIADVVGELVGG